MANLNKIVYLSEEQKEELFEKGSIEVEGKTINYNDNDLYMTNKDEYIDVRDLINTKANKSLSNIDTDGIQKIKEIVDEEITTALGSDY